MFCSLTHGLVRVLQPGPRPHIHRLAQALAEAPGPTTLPPQSSEDVVSSGPEDCGSSLTGAFDSLPESSIPSIYTDT